MKVAQFFYLARKPAEHAQVKPDLTVDDTIEILVKYLILEGCTPELRTHFLERKVRTLDVEEIQELGVAFQAAHGRAKHVDFSAPTVKSLAPLRTKTIVRPCWPGRWKSSGKQQK